MISNSTPFMRERLAAIRDQPVLARFRDVPTLDANYDYEPTAIWRSLTGISASAGPA